jgi:hypothetical protein
MGDDRVLGVERGEGEMPHAVSENAPDLAVIFRGLAPFAERTDEQVVRLPSLYLDRAGPAALLQCVVALIAVRVRDLVRTSRFGKTNLQDYLP